MFRESHFSQHTKNNSSQIANIAGQLFYWLDTFLRFPWRTELHNWGEVAWRGEREGWDKAGAGGAPTIPLYRAAASVTPLAPARSATLLPLRRTQASTNACHDGPIMVSARCKAQWERAGTDARAAAARAIVGWTHHSILTRENAVPQMDIMTIC